jgi:hypothetical protein
MLLLMDGHLYIPSFLGVFLKKSLKRSFSEIPTIFLTPYLEFDQRPHGVRRTRVS